MTEEWPAEIRIKLEYGPAYAHDEEGCVFNLSGIFSDHPNIDRIRRVEDEIYGLVSWLEWGMMEKGGYPWPEFERDAFKLAEKMASLIHGCGIVVLYVGTIYCEESHPLSKVLLSSG